MEPDALVGGTGFAAVAGWTCRRGGCDYGNVVLSRFPIVAAHRLDLTVRGREPRGALDVVASTPHGALRVIGTHLGLWPGERRAQVRKLLGGSGRSMRLSATSTSSDGRSRSWPAIR